MAITVNVGGILSAGLDRLTGVPSQWGGISPTLLARIFPVERYEVRGADGKVAEYKYRELVADHESVKAPISDSNLEATLNWQSPFENSGPENKAPSMMAIIQSGQLGSFIMSLQNALPDAVKNATNADDKIAEARDLARSIEGRTGMTKLNSTQVFSGSPPVKINMTLHFRALQNPVAEVEKPYMQLLRWAMPQKLAPDSFLANALNSQSSGQSFVETMFPSKAPQLVGFEYGGNTFMPMVIEFISNPLDGHLGITGKPVYRAVQLSMSTLAALDEGDIKQAFQRAGFI